MAMDLEGMRYMLEDAYPRGEAGELVYSQWAHKGHSWEAEDYASVGFARRYVSNQFLGRAEAAYELLSQAASKCKFSLSDASIFDFSAGPGCIAAGAVKFLMEQGNMDPQVTLFDPVREWEPAVGALEKMGVRAEFERSGNLSSMADAFEARVRGGKKPIVVCVGHALKDFGGGPKGIQEWWARMRGIIGGRRVVGLIFDRVDCNGLVPEHWMDGRKMSKEMSSKVAGHGAVFWAPAGAPAASATVPQPSVAARAVVAAQATPQVPRPPDARAFVIAKGPSNAQPSTAAHAVNAQSPRCPDCKGTMIKRTNRNGYNPGSQFWGCAAYPHCKGKRKA